MTRTFSYIGASGSKTSNVVNINRLTINARCGTGGQPIIFAFSSAGAADIFGRIFDGLGRVHIIHNTSFNKGGKGIALSTSSGDFDASATVLFETSAGKVVTVQMAFDNSTTLVEAEGVHRLRVSHSLLKPGLALAARRSTDRHRHTVSATLFLGRKRSGANRQQRPENDRKVVAKVPRHRPGKKEHTKPGSTDPRW